MYSFVFPPGVYSIKKKKTFSQLPNSPVETKQPQRVLHHVEVSEILDAVHPTSSASLRLKARHPPSFGRDMFCDTTKPAAMREGGPPVRVVKGSIYPDNYTHPSTTWDDL